MAKSSPTLGTDNSYVASILSIPSYLRIVCTRIFNFPEIVKKYALLVYFWVPSGPSKARMRANTEVRSALPSAKPSLPRGLLRGEPPNVPVANVFRNISVSTLSFSYPWKKMDARRKQLRYGAGRVVGPPTPPGYGTPLTTLHLRCLWTRTSSQMFI